MYRNGVPSFWQGTSAFAMYPYSSELSTLAAMVSSFSPFADDSNPCSSLRKKRLSKHKRFSNKLRMITKRFVSGCVRTIGGRKRAHQCKRLSSGSRYIMPQSAANIHAEGPNIQTRPGFCHCPKIMRIKNHSEFQRTRCKMPSHFSGLRRSSPAAQRLPLKLTGIETPS